VSDVERDVEQVAATAMTYYRDYLPTWYAELDDPAEYLRTWG
jgi:hypothetical protein